MIVVVDDRLLIYLTIIFKWNHAVQFPSFIEVHCFTVSSGRVELMSVWGSENGYSYRWCFYWCWQKHHINPKNPWSRTGSRSGISQSGYQRQRQKSLNQENSPDQKTMNENTDTKQLVCQKLYKHRAEQKLHKAWVCVQCAFVCKWHLSVHMISNVGVVVLGSHICRP